MPQAPRTGVVAIARRPSVDLAAVLADPRAAPVVLLEQPRNMGNIGACVRVAAAADAAALLTIGENDPWYPDAVRGAAGLHFALPAVAGGRASCRREDAAAARARPRGGGARPGEVPPRAVLAFGTERHGLTGELLGRGRRPGRDPDAGRRLQPQPRDLGRRGALRTPFAMRLAEPDSV